jgi:MoaA/NifB/PqqE/SkfB family radical SAM enzyme
VTSKFLSNYLPEIFALKLNRTKPAMVTVNLTQRCNQRCIYCEIGNEKSQQISDVLSIDDLKWIVDQMALHKIRKLSLCGGEPFLFEGIIQLVEYAAKNGIRCSVTTNGMTVHKIDKAEIEVLKKSKTRINVSVDSFDQNIQSLTRGANAALPNALKSITRLMDHGIPVTVLTVITRYNYQTLSELTKQACIKGIRQILFQPVITYSNYPERPPVDQKSKLNVPTENLSVMMSELHAILKFERRHKISTNVYRIVPWIEHYISTAERPEGRNFWDNVLNAFYCREVYAIVDISHDGGIQPCGLAPAKVFIQKNSGRGLIPLWNDATREIRNDLDKGRFYDICNGCCHHFSRNMLASLAKYPLKNRVALLKMIKLVFLRMQWRIIKKML